MGQACDHPLALSDLRNSGTYYGRSAGRRRYLACEFPAGERRALVPAGYGLVVSRAFRF